MVRLGVRHTTPAGGDTATHQRAAERPAVQEDEPEGVVPRYVALGAVVLIQRPRRFLTMGVRDRGTQAVLVCLAGEVHGVVSKPGSPVGRGNVGLCHAAGASQLKRSREDEPAPGVVGTTQQSAQQGEPQAAAPIVRKRPRACEPAQRNNTRTWQVCHRSTRLLSPPPSTRPGPAHRATRVGSGCPRRGCWTLWRHLPSGPPARGRWTRQQRCRTP